MLKDAKGELQAATTFIEAEETSGLDYRAIRNAASQAQQAANDLLRASVILEMTQTKGEK